jgi:hypothetical protein
MQNKLHNLRGLQKESRLRSFTQATTTGNCNYQLLLTYKNNINNTNRLVTYCRWAFPINEKSQYGLKYTIGKDDVAKLQADDTFMNNFCKGVKLVMWAWGYDVEKRIIVENPLAGTALYSIFHFAF